MTSKKDLIVFLCDEINRHGNEIDRLSEKLREIKTKKFVKSMEEKE